MTKYFTNTAINDSAWHPVVLQVSEITQSIWVDGQQKVQNMPEVGCTAGILRCSGNESSRPW